MKPQGQDRETLEELGPAGVEVGNPRLFSERLSPGYRALLHCRVWPWWLRCAIKKQWMGLKVVEVRGAVTERNLKAGEEEALCLDSPGKASSFRS